MNIFLSSLLLIIGSFFGGVIASVSPCSIGMLPLILAYVCGSERKSNIELVLKLLSFSLGLSLVLGLLGIACAITGQVFGGINSPVLILIFGSLLMLFGLQLLGIIDLQLPQIVKKIPQNDTTSQFLYPFTLGILFAFVSSPCSSPILAAIMTMAAVSSDFITSFLMLFSFAFGQCIIIILAGLFASFLKNLQKFQKYSDILIKFSGIILVIFAFIIWINVFINFFNK